MEPPSRGVGHVQEEEEEEEESESEPEEQRKKGKPKNLFCHQRYLGVPNSPPIIVKVRLITVS